MSTTSIPKRLFVYETGEFTQFSILLDETWVMFRSHHCPTEKMISWIDNRDGFDPEGEEIPGLESRDEELLACIKLIASLEEMEARFGVLDLHFEHMPETTRKAEKPTEF